MKIAGLALLALLCAPLQDDDAARKKRLGEIYVEMNRLTLEAAKLMRQLAGDDQEKQRAIMNELMQKHLPPEMNDRFVEGQRTANERLVAATLKTLSTANADFRANDRDRNFVNDFWVGDVSGLWRIDADNTLKLIEIAVAAADARPLLPLEQDGQPAAAPQTKYKAVGNQAPKAGYWFSAIEKRPFRGEIVKYDEGNGRCRSGFGFCAYPAEYGPKGKFTYIINEDNSVYRKDTGGKPVPVWPADPSKEDWVKLD
jgi:hypothetical protein